MRLSLTTPSPKLLVLLILVLFSLSAFLFRPEADSVALAQGFIFLLTGIYLYARSFPTANDQTTFSTPAITKPDQPFHPRAFIVAILAMAALIEINTGVLSIAFLQNTTVSIQVILLMIAVIALLIALSAWRGELPTIDWSQSIPVIWLTILAFGVRFIGLGSFVSQPINDEYSFTGAAMALIDNDQFRLFEPFDAGYTFSWTYPHLIANSLTLFGQSVASIRIVSVIFGTLTIPALYFLGKNLFDRRIAFLAAMLLATFPPHIHLSRLGLNNVADPFFGTVALGLMVRGLKQGNARDFTFAGIVLGFTQYFYEGGRLLYPPLILLWLLSINWPNRTTHRRLFLRGAVAFVILALPVYLTLFATGYSLTPRLTWVAPDESRYAAIRDETVPRNRLSTDWTERFIGVLLFFVHTPDNSYEFYGGPQPMILTPIVPVFLMGALFALQHWRDRNYRLLLIWIGLAIAGISLIKIGAWTARYVVIFPAIVYTIALGVRTTLRYLVPSRIHETTTIFVVFTIATLQLAYYFGPHLTVYNQQIRPHLDYVDAYQRALAYSDDTGVIFVTDDIVWQPYMTVIGALADKQLPIEVYATSKFTLETARDLSVLKGYAVFVTADDVNTPQILRRYRTIHGPFASPYNVPKDKQYMLYYVPPES